MILLLDGEGNPLPGRCADSGADGGAAALRGAVLFFRCERKYQRKPAARRLQRRPTSLCAVGFGLREPNGWMPRINSGHPIPALRPEQSDHVPWADCPQGLSSASARCTHPPGKSPLLPIFERGSSQCRAQHCWTVIPYYRARSCSLFSSFKKGQGFFPSLPIAALLRRQLSEVELKWRKLGCCCAAWLALPRQRPAWFWNPCWPSLRAMRPVAEWRSVHANKQGITLNPRAMRPVAERRYLRSQLACLPSTPAPYGRGVGSRGTTPCARPVAERR